jgi:DNA-binding transcriptional MerR regulator
MSQKEHTMRGHTMSPRQITKELNVSPQAIRYWVKTGKLTPASYTAGGHARYDRADIDAIKAGRSERTAKTVDPEASLAAKRLAALGRANLQAAEPKRPEGARKISPEIERAMKAAARARKVIAELDRLQNEAVNNLLGVSKGQLFVLLWQAPMTKVGAFLGMRAQTLKRICNLYDVPLPQAGYWSTRPQHRTMRISSHWMPFKSESSSTNETVADKTATPDIPQLAAA